MKKMREFIGLYKPAIVPLALLPQIDLIPVMIIFIILSVICPDPYFEKDKYYYISMTALLGIGAILLLGFHQEVMGVVIMSVAFIVVHTIYWRKQVKQNEV